MVHNDDARDVRSKLREEAEHAPRPTRMSRKNVRRARIRRTAVVSVSALGILLVAAAVGLGVTRMGEERGRHQHPVDPAPSPTAPSSPGKIVFTRFSRDGGIVVMDADGAELHKVADNRGAYALDDPAWSPDGTKIAFHGFFGKAADEAGGLFLVDSNGSNLRLLERGGTSPSWSPDGGEIAFAKEGTLYKIRASGGRSRPLVMSQAISSLDWSPDGNRIAFSLDGLYVVDPSGGEPEKILDPVDSSQRPFGPEWSPDSSLIAFTLPGGDQGEGIVNVVRPDGRGLHALTEGNSPAWSPDGQRIVFVRIDGSASHLYSMSVGGTGLQQLTFGPDSDHSPDWTAVGSSAPSFSCPELIWPGHRPRQAMRSAVTAYLDARQLEGTSGYGYRVKRLTRRVLGGPEAACSVKIWRRSFQIEGHFKYIGTPKNQSASLSYFRVIAGRTEGGWVVWAEPH